MEITAATLSYIEQHSNDDPRALALRGCSDPQVDIRFALQQIQGRQKARTKLPAWAENPGVLFPPTLAMEQCSSEQTAQYKSALVAGEVLIDCSGGFGIDTFHFARRFAKCHYIEPQTELCEMVRHNALQMGIDNLQLHNQRMEEVLNTLPDATVIYIDPSRRDAHGNRVISLQQCEPDITLWHHRLLAKAPTVMVKLSPMIDIRQTLRLLPETAEVHVVAVHGECKEVLLMLRREPTFNRRITAIDLREAATHPFVFTEEEEQQARPETATALSGWLYEPNAAILKAGAFKRIATYYGLQKLHPHTHLYTSTQRHNDFPGRIFKIEAVCSPNKKQVKKELQGITSANISVRNFPFTADQLRRQLGLRDGSDCWLIGTTWGKDEKVIIKAQWTVNNFNG